MTSTNASAVPSAHLTGLPILKNILRSRVKALLIWGLALASICGMYVGLYPSMEKMDMQGMIDSMPPVLVEALGYQDMNSAAGYIGTSIYGMLGMILMLVFSIMNGGRLLAGIEEEGALELELTSPVPRSTVFHQRLSALWLQIIALTLVVVIVNALLCLVMNLDVSMAHLATATVQLTLLAGLFGSVAFALGAATGRKGIALGAASGLAVVAYMLNAFTKTLDMPWMASVSPISWFIAENPVIHGAQFLDVFLLAATSVVILIVGKVLFLRRDLMT